jgi:hypothetical protein
MSGKGRNTGRRPATKFANLRKKMDRNKLAAHAARKKK